MELNQAKEFVGNNKAAFSSSGGKPATTMMPMYFPMSQTGEMVKGGKKVPVHVATVMTRGDFVSGVISDTERAGSGLGSAYRGYFYAMVFFVLTAVTMYYSLYLAAVFAFATGHYWSSRVIAPAWNITWFKGKALYHTK